MEELEKEHVFPANLYPKSKAESKVQRLTIPACRSCNGAWADDEAHFRSVLVLSGPEPNTPREQLWHGPVMRSFDQPDGWRRLEDLLSIMKEVDQDGNQRAMIYPADDPRILRVVRKAIRGLAFYHGLFSSVPADWVWVDVERYKIPDTMLANMIYHHREKDIAEYWYEVFDQPQLHSAWIVRFFESASFVGLIEPKSLTP